MGVVAPLVIDSWVLCIYSVRGHHLSLGNQLVAQKPGCVVDVKGSRQRTQQRVIHQPIIEYLNLFYKLLHRSARSINGIGIILARKSRLSTFQLMGSRSVIDIPAIPKISRPDDIDSSGDSGTVRQVSLLRTVLQCKYRPAKYRQTRSRL